jgi:hypothetical protein
MNRRAENRNKALRQLWKAQDDGGQIGPDSCTTDEGWRYRADVMCYVERLDYCFASRQGTLYVREGNCTDMLGCIALFQAIDQRVRRIQTASGTRPDAAYILDGGEWTARCMRPAPANRNHTEV